MTDTPDETKTKATETSTAPGTSNAMWGGRFECGPAEIMERINASIDFDGKLYGQDIAGSKAHADMLAACGIISREDEAEIQRGLDLVRREIETGRFTFRRDLEDIHLNIEHRLTELIGPTAGRLHTARSRNDQVATDFRLWVRASIDHLMVLTEALIEALLTQAERHADLIMPGFTHLQVAQPITFGHHLMAYVAMLERDLGRLRDARARMNECPLGAAALAGTSFPINRARTAKALGFARPTANSLDSVASRDFALEYLSTCAILGIHLSRLAEELVIWTSAQFRFVSLTDGFTTGSSIMPQKRNPDAAELCRAKVGRVIGALNSLLIVMKGLPLAYAKDMQEDKEPVFDAALAIELVVVAMAGMVADLTPNRDALRAAAASGFSTATDLADWLVRCLGLPFREAHHITGRIVKHAETKGVDLDALTLADMQTVEARITDEVFKVLSVENSVASRKSYGGTAPSAVRAQVAEARDRQGARS